jgi:hypothetical protein
VTLAGAFPDTPEGRGVGAELEEAVAFGTTVTIPADYVQALTIDAPDGLGGHFENVAVTLSGTESPLPQIVDAELRVLGNEGTHLASMPIRFERHHRGSRGVIAYGRDPLNVVEIRLQLDISNQAGSMNLRYRLPSDALPVTALPMLRFLESLRKAETIEMRIGGTAAGTMAVPETQVVDENFVNIVETLARVQSGTHSYFAIPDELSSEDLKALSVADRLLSGQRVAFTWDNFRTTLATVADDTLARVTESEVASLQFVESDHVETISGHEVHIGPVRHTIPSARIANRDALKLIPGQLGTQYELHVVPHANSDGEMERIPAEELPPS